MKFFFDNNCVIIFCIRINTNDCFILIMFEIIILQHKKKIPEDSYKILNHLANVTHHQYAPIAPC